MPKVALNRRINKKLLQEVLDSFTVITGIRVAFMDETDSYVVGRDREISSFCSKIRKYDLLDAACKSCDIQAFEKVAKEREPYIYRCHMGFMEAVVPLTVGKNHAGFLMIGQIRCAEDGPELWKLVCSKLRRTLPEELILELEKDFSGISTMSEDGIQASVRMLQIIGQYVVTNDIVHVSEKDSIEKTKLLLQDTYRHKLDIHALAENAKLNATYLSYLFKKTTGTTLSAYVDQLRIEHAEALLKNTSKPVKEIALEIGYEDPNYFSRVFKKYKSVSPLIYRHRFNSH